MTDPFPNDSGSTNGANARDHSINGHEEIQAKLPQNRPSQALPAEEVHPQTRRDIRRTFLILLATGLVIGVLTAAGVIWVMNRLDLIGVPEQQEQL
jgi:hypothetical protein